MTGPDQTVTPTCPSIHSSCLTLNLPASGYAGAGLGGIGGVPGGVGVGGVPGAVGVGGVPGAVGGIGGIGGLGVSTGMVAGHE